MSRTIDQRVVEMRFDNSHFEKNVSTTMSTLDKLKSKLNLSGASKGLENINTAAKNVNMSGLGSAVDTVTTKFSALQVMGVTALANITNSAVNAGKNIVKSLTIDPIKSGFSEYETKMGSIQTILANTEHQGTTLDDVTSALDELNLYADKTIYNFQEMTRNIGTFTAAGVDLDTSVRSIQGIANLAAVSGSTSQQASTAMYQLSQALATGTVKLMDWNSVVNAGMGGKVFQNALIQTAAMLDGAAENVEAWQKKNIDAFGSFRDSLTQGEWLTGEVLTKTLEQFTMAAEEGSEQWEAFKKSLMSEGYTEKQAESILKMANTATDAATKVKTFTQLMDTLKESAQSGWAQTWETIVGDFEEAKAFFTELSDIFGGIIGDSANRRNNFVTEVFSSNWDKLIKQINDAGIETQQFEESIRRVVGDNKLDSLIEQCGSLEKAVRSGAIGSDVLKKALADLGKTGEKAFDFTEMAEKVKDNRFLYVMGRAAGDEVKKIQEALNSLGYDLSPDGKFGKATYQAVMAFQKAQGIKIDGIVGEETIAALEKATGMTGELTTDVDGLNESCDNLIDVITKTSGRELLLNSLLNIIKAIQRPLSAVGEAFRNTFAISPETLYKGLEKIEKFTSKLVPKGILDSTTWANITSKVNDLGITTTEFELKLAEVLEKNGIDVNSLIDKYGDLGEAFMQGAISIDHIKEALLGFEGITESLLNGGENVDKLRKTFEGLLAIFDIIGTLAGSGIKIAFDVLSAVLSHFDMDILDLTANIADTIIKFRDWIESLIDIKGAVEVILPYVEDFVKAIGEGFDKFKKTEEFEKLISFFSKAGKAFMDWVEALKSSENLGEDIVAGLIAGLKAGVGVVWDAAVALAESILESICNFLGIHSPATTMIEVGKNVIDGLVVGLQNGVSGLWTTVKDIGAKLLNWFKNLDFGAIFAVGIGASMIWVVKTIGDALSILAVPFEGFGSMLEDLGDMFEGIGASFKAEAWEKRANAIKGFAIAIAILAASVYVLAQLKPAELWSAVGAIAALATIIGTLSFVIGKFGASKDGGSKIKQFMSSINFAALGTALTGLSFAALGLAAAAKIIGGMNPEEAKQGILGLAAIIGALTVFMATCGMVVRGEHSKNIRKIGGMMIKMSFALILIAGAIKLISKLTPDELTAGAEFITAFMLFTAVFAALGAIPGKGIEGVGSMMLKMSVAMIMMIGVVKLAGQLSNANGELDKANAFIGGFIGIVLLLQLISMIPGHDMSKLGGTLMGISGAMLIMVGVAKLIANMEWDDMAKAGVGILGLTGIIALLALTVKKLGGDAPKIAGTLLAMSIAIGVLAGIAILMGMLKVEHLAKGLAAVTVLGLVMAAMVAAARGVKRCVGELVVMTVAVGLMAAAVAALSLIEPGPLSTATTAMTILMGMFAIVIKSANNATGSIGVLIVITGAITILAGIVYLLSGLPVDSVVGTALSLSALLLALSVSLKILSTINSVSVGAMVAMGAMLLIVAGLAAILGVMSALDCAPSLETALAISTLLLAMSAVYVVLGLTGGLAGPALAGAAGMMGVIAIIGGIALAIGGLMSLIPADKISEWKTGLQNFMDFITILATGLGEAVGGLIGGLLEGLAPGIESFSGSITKLTEALGPFSEAAKQLDADTVAGVQSLVDIVTAITASSFIEKIATMFGGSSMETFATQLKAFGTAMKNYAAEVVGLDTASISASATAAQGIVQVAQAIPGDGFLGLDGIDDFGRNIVVFGKAMKSYSEEVNGLNCTAIQSSVGAAKWLVDIANSIPADGFLGLDGIDDFGRNIKTFGKSLKGYAEEVAEINPLAVSSSVSAARGLVEVANLIPDDGTLGMDGIDDFGKNIKSFGKSMKSYSEEVSEVNSGAVSSSVTNARRIVSFINSLSGIDTSGVGAFKDAVKNLAKVNVGDVVTAFSAASASLTDVGANMTNALANGFKSKSSQLKVSATTVVNDMTSTFRSRLTSFVDVGGLIGSSLIKGFTLQRTKLQSAVIAAIGSAVSGVRSQYSNIYSSGAYIGAGLVAGVNAMRNAAYQAGVSLGEAVNQGIADTVDLGSPSKVAIQYGKWIGEGLVIGVDRMGSAVYNAGSAIGKEAVGAISDTISKISDIVNSDIDTQPTIRPVMDLSNVKTGVGAVNSMLDFGSSVGVLANVNGINNMMNRRSQNGADSEVVSAIDKLRREIGNMPRESYSINGITYDDGSNIAGAMREIVRAAKTGRRV